MHQIFDTCRIADIQYVKNSNLNFQATSGFNRGDAEYEDTEAELLGGNLPGKVSPFFFLLHQ